MEQLILWLLLGLGSPQHAKCPIISSHNLITGEVKKGEAACQETEVTLVSQGGNSLASVTFHWGGGIHSEYYFLAPVPSELLAGGKPKHGAVWRERKYAAGSEDKDITLFEGGVALYDGKWWVWYRVS